MAKSELKDLYCKIVRPDVECKYFSGSIDFKGIIDHFKDVENQDSPDGIILLGNIVYMVEHFQISIYDKGNGDKLQQALRAKNTRNLGNTVSLFDDSEDGERQLLKNWLAGFSQSLEEHLNHYHTYEETAQKRYPNMLYKFILVVEDNSNSIVTNDNLCILDIKEFVEKILSYDKIDGVVTFNTSTRGNSVIAKDRAHLKADIDNGSLRGILTCNLLALIEKVDIGEFTPEMRIDLKEKICRILGNEKEDVAMKDDTQVIKHDV